jgi:hypothetical protein
MFGTHPLVFLLMYLYHYIPIPLRISCLLVFNFLPELLAPLICFHGFTLEALKFLAIYRSKVDLSYHMNLEVFVRSQAHCEYLTEQNR